MSLRKSIIFKSATQIAQMIRKKQCSVIEVFDAHIEQVEKHNKIINAIVTLDIEGARDQAKKADLALSRGEIMGPLHGVPMTVKDNYDTIGVRNTRGNPRYMNYIPKRDATIVAKLRSAGAIIFGKTNLPSRSFDWQCKHPKFGRTNNPWNIECTPGGSSGGSAAALAAGFTPIELGNDYAGSLRVPAHFCGICSIRPTENSVSNVGGQSYLPGYPLCIRNL